MVQLVEDEVESFPLQDIGGVTWFSVPFGRKILRVGIFKVNTLYKTFQGRNEVLQHMETKERQGC